MRIRSMALHILALLSGAAAAPWCLAEPMSFELRPATTAVIAAPVMLEGTARYPDRYELSSSLTGLATGPFTILKAEVGDARREGGVKIQKVLMVLSVFDLGPQTLPSLPWTLSQSSQAAQVIRSPPVKLDVSGPKIEPGDIRDIKGPLSAPSWPFLAMAIMAGLIVLFAAREISRRCNPRPASAPAPAQDTRPAHVIALEALDELRRCELDPKEYYIRLSDILRAYLERRFEIPAPVLTTWDLLRHMRQSEIDPNAIRGTKDLLERADLVKFAKFVPSESARRRDVESAAAIVSSTLPQPPAPDSPPARP